MEAGGPWDATENDAVVDVYLEMLHHEFRDERYSKAEANARLQRSIGRSRGSIEYKFQNVSAVLQDLNHPWVPGYKPAKNYQSSLREVVVAHLDDRPALAASAFELLTRPPARGSVRTDFHFDVVDAPRVEFGPERERTRRAIRRDYVQLDAQNRALGLEGERRVVELEQRRLRERGLDRLASRVEHVSQTRGDGLGYDIRSFTPDGDEKFIEVKTTRLGPTWPMLVSRNEVDFSREEAVRFHLYRLFQFDHPVVGLYELAGDISASCELRPELSSAVPRGALAG